jgi:hypothetical protein
MAGYINFSDPSNTKVQFEAIIIFNRATYYVVWKGLVVTKLIRTLVTHPNYIREVSV